MTIKEFTDTIIADFRRTSPIRYISRRHIYNKATGIIKTLLQQSLSDRRLYRDTTVQTEILCTELEQIDSLRCPIKSFRECDTIMKTKHKLPQPISGGRGVAIIGVYTVDYGEEIFRTTISKSAMDSRRKSYTSTPDIEYIYLDGYIYIKDHYIESINIILVTVDSITAEKIQCDNECDECKPHYDYRLINMDKSSIDLGTLVKQSLLQDYMAIPPTRVESQQTPQQ